MTGVAARARTVPAVLGFKASSVSGCVAWFKAEGLGLADAAAVASWTDESGNNRHATQAAGGQQPTFRVAIAGGRPAVRFDGTNDLLTTASVLGAATARSIVVVARRIGGSHDYPRVWEVDENTGGLLVQHVASDKWGYYDGDGGVMDFGGNASSFAVLSIVVASGSAATGYLNGTSVATFVPHPTVLFNAVLLLGGANNAAEGPFGGEIAELAAWNKALSAGERQQVERAWGAKYGITVA